MDTKPVKYLVKYWPSSKVQDISSSENFVALSEKHYVESTSYPFLDQLLKFYINNDLDSYKRLSSDLKINIFSTYFDLNNPEERAKYPYQLKNAIASAFEEEGYVSTNEADNGSLGSSISYSQLDLEEARRMFGDLVKTSYEDTQEGIESDSEPLPPAISEPIVDTSPEPEDWKTPYFFSNNEILIRDQNNSKHAFLIPDISDPNKYLETLTDEKYISKWDEGSSKYTDFLKKKETYHSGKLVKIEYKPLKKGEQIPSWNKKKKQSKTLKAIVDRLIKFDYIHECELQVKQINLYKSIAKLKENIKLLKFWKEENEESDNYEYEEEGLSLFSGLDFD